MRWLIAVIASLPSLALAAACQVDSGKYQTPVIELFTSEGCSSCPPADRWLAEKVARAPEVIGLSFHVDYWNYLGWSDPFSDAQFSARQRQYRRDGITRGVYTPQVLVSGRELPNWRQTSAWPQAQRMASQAASVVLSLSAEQASVSLRWLEAPQAATLRLLWLTPEAQSQVPSGENAGRTLRHANVVRAWSAPIEVSVASARERRWRITPPAAAAELGDKGQWVALLQSTVDQRVLQAVQGAWQACR